MFETVAISPDLAQALRKPQALSGKHNDLNSSTRSQSSSLRLMYILLDYFPKSLVATKIMQPGNRDELWAALI